MLTKEKSFSASAPGSLMLLGEYAVLYHKPALVCAVDKRMRVTLRPRQDRKIIVQAEGYGTWQSSVTELSITPPFHFVSACLCRYRKKLPSGCELSIQTEFSDQVGLGSSAAVTVATIAALWAWLGRTTFQPLALIREARQLIREVQGLGSGADVAAAVMGGVLAYRSSPLAVEKFTTNLPLTVIYSGAKTPTAEAVRRVREKFMRTPALFNTLCRGIHQCAKEGIAALHENNLSRLGAAMNVQQGLMQALGVSTPLLNALIADLRANSAISGAKISGSGWGDCVIGLGATASLAIGAHDGVGVKQLTVAVTQQGVEVQ